MRVGLGSHFKCRIVFCHVIKPYIIILPLMAGEVVPAFSTMTNSAAVTDPFCVSYAHVWQFLQGDGSGRPSGALLW